jgi:hypothetical protein
VGDGLLSAAIQSPDGGKTGGARGRRAGLTLKSAGLRSTNMPTTLHIEALNEPLIEVQPVQVGLLCRFQLGVPPENGKAAQC